MTELHILRKPCSNCGKSLGKIAKRNGQNVVYCIYCDMFQYNAPKTETGEEVRSISTIRDGIKPRLRMEILERDGRCVVCLGDWTVDLRLMLRILKIRVMRSEDV